MAGGGLSTSGVLAALRQFGSGWSLAACEAAEAIRPSLRFYLSEPSWWRPGRSLEAVARSTASALLLTLCAATMARVVDPENSFMLGLWLACAAAALLLWACALGAMAVLGCWISLWWLGTVRRRAHCRRIITANGWPRVAMSPRLLDFSPAVWGRLPPYDQFAATPWCPQRESGPVHPLDLYAALTLIEELEQRSACYVNQTPEEAAEERVRELALVLESGRSLPEAGDPLPERPTPAPTPLLWVEALLQPFEGARSTRGSDHRTPVTGNPAGKDAN